jgi:hypothetical protein
MPTMSASSAAATRATAAATRATSFPRMALALPGGGVFFWWQAGAVHGLSRRLDLSTTPLVGASAGALAATLAACQVDMPTAFDSALRMSNDAGVFQKGPWGLCGIWGPIVRNWLDELLPDDAAERCGGRVSLIVRQVQLGSPRVSPIAVSEFESRADLIDTCMASVHVPLFLDGRMTTELRGARCIDGSLALPGLPPVRYELPKRFADVPVSKLSPFKDPRMRARYSRTSDFLRLSGEPALREMMQWGEEHVATMEWT